MSHTLWTSAAMACALGLGAAVLAPPSHAQDGYGVSISVGYAPPELPVYDQPPMPDDGYIWTPGYWAWDQDEGDYYWTPGTWVRPPREDLVWTPSYWDYDNGRYLFVSGYWDNEVGYYGGVDYGYGYGGHGYDGGEWRDHRFYYNREVNNFAGVRITNVFDRRVDRNAGRVRTSYTGGPGGMTARPTAQQQAASGRPHVAPTGEQMQQVQRAAAEPGLRASVNHGAPTIAATPRAAAFSGPGVVRTVTAPRVYQRPATAPSPAMDRSPASMPARPDVVTVRPVQQTPGWTPSPRPANAQDNRTQNVRPSGPGPSMDRAPQRQDVVHAQPNAQPPPRAAPPAQVKPESAHPAAEAKPERDKGAGADQQH